MIISIVLAQMCLFAKICKVELKMPAGNTINLCSHLSCKHREMCSEMIGKELSNVSVTSQNKCDLA